MHPGSAGGNFGFRGVYKKQTLSIWRRDAGTQLTVQMGGDVLFLKKLKKKKIKKRREGGKKKSNSKIAFLGGRVRRGVFCLPGWEEKLAAL